jgi:hypothetical protein
METLTQQESLVGGAEMSEWELPFRRVLGCMLHVAMLASRFGMSAEAEAILQPIEAVRPGHASPKLGRALLFFYQKKYQESVDYLNSELLSVEPANSIGLAFKAMALHGLNRMGEAKALVETVLAANNDQAAVGLARSLSEELGMQV